MESMRRVIEFRHSPRMPLPGRSYIHVQGGSRSVIGIAGLETSDASSLKGGTKHSIHDFTPPNDALKTN